MMSNGFTDSPYEKDDVIEPKFQGYQLIGDSQFLRFSERILNENRKKWNKYALLGLCVSGQKTCDLLERIKNEFHPISEKVILMIGTNDLLQGTNSAELRAKYKNLVLHLIEKGKVEKLIVLTVPPVPRLKNSPEHWNTLKELNKQIREFHNGEDIIVIDAYPKFIKARSSPLLSRHSLPSSRSSLVSYSSGTSSPSHQNSSNKIKIPHFTSNFGKIRTNLRIEVEDSNSKADSRTIYLKGPDSSSDDEDCSESGNELRINVTPNCKRSHPSSGLSSPNPKRKSVNSGSHDLSQDDHNDVFYYDDNPQNGEQFEKINEDYFEKFFDKQGSREDLIHLNNKGLLLIKNLILDIIRG